MEPKQGRQDSNLQPPVLETGALPIELLPSARAALYRPTRALDSPSWPLPRRRSARRPLRAARRACFGGVAAYAAIGRASGSSRSPRPRCSALWMGELAYPLPSDRPAYPLRAVAQSTRSADPLARVQVTRRTAAIRDRLILTYAPLVKYVAGRLGVGPPGARRRERSRLLRPARPDRRDRAVRPRSRRQVRDVCDRPHPRRDHRRAALDGLGAAFRPLAGAGDRAGDRAARGQLLRRAHRRGDRGEAGRQRGGARRRAARDLALVDRARSTSCGRARPARATRSRSSTRSRIRTRSSPAARSRRPR